MKYKTSKTLSKEFISVSIRLDDECKNGHQDFSITADIYGANKPRSDRYYICGGCCHDKILKAFPEFKIFVNLHSCDYDGVPMYAVENGFYHLKTGFDRLDGKTQKECFCDYYRMTAKQYDFISKSKNKLEFAILLRDLGILKQWKEEAKKAIKILEKMTGEKFINTSTKSNYNLTKHKTYH